MISPNPGGILRLRPFFRSLLFLRGPAHARSALRYGSAGYVPPMGSEGVRSGLLGALPDGNSGEAQAQIPVPVRGRAGAAVGRPAVLGVEAPAAAPIHAIGAFRFE
jgi:hypothetical protein